MNFLDKISQKVFHAKNSPQVFISIDNVSPGIQWKEKEKIAEKNLPDHIFALLLDNGIQMKFLVSKKKEDFSFRKFCKANLQFDYELSKVEQVELATIVFQRGDLIYVLKKSEKLYEASVYERR